MIKKSVFDRAVKVARSSNVVRGKVGAVLFTDSGHVVSSACNATMLGYKQRFTMHAEEFVLAKSFRVKAVERFGRENLNILIVRHRPIAGIGCARPCARCSHLLMEAGIRVFYTDETGSVRQYL